MSSKRFEQSLPHLSCHFPGSSSLQGTPRWPRTASIERLRTGHRAPVCGAGPRVRLVAGACHLSPGRCSHHHFHLMTLAVLSQALGELATSECLSGIFQAPLVTASNCSYNFPSCFHRPYFELKGKYYVQLEVRVAFSCVSDDIFLHSKPHF